MHLISGVITLPTPRQWGSVVWGVNKGALYPTHSHDAAPFPLSFPANPPFPFCPSAVLNGGPGVKPWNNFGIKDAHGRVFRAF